MIETLHYGIKCAVYFALLSTSGVAISSLVWHVFIISYASFSQSYRPSAEKMKGWLLMFLLVVPGAFLCAAMAVSMKW
jgi:hypothetical protein